MLCSLRAGQLAYSLFFKDGWWWCCCSSLISVVKAVTQKLVSWLRFSNLLSVRGFKSTAPARSLTTELSRNCWRYGEEGQRRENREALCFLLNLYGCSAKYARFIGPERKRELGKKELDSKVHMRTSSGRKKEPSSSMFLMLLINLVLNKILQ